MSTSVCARTHACVTVFVCVCMCVCVHVHACVCVCVHVCMCTHTTCVCTHTNVYRWHACILYLPYLAKYIATYIPMLVFRIVWLQSHTDTQRLLTCYSSCVTGNSTSLRKYKNDFHTVIPILPHQKLDQWFYT